MKKLLTYALPMNYYMLHYQLKTPEKIGQRGILCSEMTIPTN